MSRQRLTKEEIEDIHRLRDCGKTIYFIAKNMGVTEKTILKYYYDDEYELWKLDFAIRWDEMLDLFEKKKKKVSEIPKNEFDLFSYEWEKMRALFGKGSMVK